MTETLGHILIVDDNEMNRDMLSRRLVRQGHTVVIAKNGRHGLERLRAEAFDLVLLDIMMPEMNGYQMLEAIKADETLRNVPVIMISAVDELESVVRCIQLGAEDYLPKPFNPVLLKARINAVLDKKRLSTSPLQVEKATTTEELRQAFRDAAAGPMKGILADIDEPLVSIDFKGDPHSSSVDLPFTMVLGKDTSDFVKVVTWYDNEWGYSERTADLANLMASRL